MKYSGPPSCVSCKHFLVVGVQNSIEGVFQVCQIEKMVNLDYSSVMYLTIETAREQEDLCGTMGKWWEPIEKDGGK